MPSYNKITPEGTRDTLFEQCETRRRVQQALAALLESRGFDEVMTPGLEFYDVFSSSAAHFPQESMYKLSDNKGRLLVMRPDCTIPIARLTATKLGGLPRPLRLYYSQQIYRRHSAMRGVSDEFCQMGVELIGASGEGADLEMLQLAAQCLASCGLEGFRLEICHIGFFKKLVAAAGLTPEAGEEARQLIEAKNYAALNDLLDNGMDSPALRSLRSLPRLFGPVEILEQAESLLEEASPEVEAVRRLCRGMENLGLKDKVMVDLGLVNQAEYYTGVIFRGYLEGVGEPVLSGGRYDGLMADFGEPAPATGFAVNVDLVASALLQSDPGRRQPIAFLIHGGPGYWEKALREGERLAREGFRCEVSPFEREEEAMDYARRRGVRTLRLVGERPGDIILTNEGERP